MKRPSNLIIAFIRAIAGIFLAYALGRIAVTLVLFLMAFNLSQKNQLQTPQMGCKQRQTGIVKLREYHIERLALCDAATIQSGKELAKEWIQEFATEATHFKGERCNPFEKY